MRCAWGKLVVALVLLVAILQIVHMLLLSHLEAWGDKRSGSGEDSRRSLGHRVVSPETEAGSSMSSAMASGDALALAAAAAFSPEEVEDDNKNPEHRSNIEGDVRKDVARMARTVRASSVLDSSGEFKIVPLLAPGSYSNKDDVTMVTQCSSQKLHMVAALAQRWAGPLSVAVFVPGPNLTATLGALARLRACFPHVRNNCSFHIVYPIGHQVHDAELAASSSVFLDGDTTIKCDSLVHWLRSTSGSWPNYELQGARVPYPTNMLRNVARRAALSEFVFVVDVDLMPNSGLHQDFARFARSLSLFSSRQRDDKSVYVVPAFETDDDTAPPEDKAQLLRLVERSRARPFYVQLCWKCQKHTDYEAWQREPVAPSLGVLFEVLWKDPWEPFYIGRNSAPLYDERFKQYGFNRISQVCELHIAGYKFSVLNNAFLVHQGLKTADSFHRRKDLDQEHNRLLFRQFKTELKEKYPESSRRCY